MAQESEVESRVGQHRSVQEMLVSGEPLTPERSLRLVCAAARALDTLHARQIVHGAISPAALQIDANDQITLLPPGHTRGGGADLSTRYWSPQRRAGELPRPTDDFYALGLLAYQLLAGRLPDSAWLTSRPVAPLPSAASTLTGAGGSSLRPRLASESSSPPVAGSDAVTSPLLSAGIEAVLRAQLAWAPAMRPASGAELARELEWAAHPAAARAGATSTDGVPAAEPSWAAARRVAQAREARRLAQAAVSDVAHREAIRRRQEADRRLRETERLMPPQSRVLLRGVNRSSHPDLPLPGGWVLVIAVVLCSVYLLPVYFMLFPHG